MECVDENRLAGYVHGALSALQVQEIESHLQACPDCRQLARLLDSQAATQPPDDLGVRADESPSARDNMLPEGRNLGRYRVDDTIGSGSMGIVLAGYDPELKRKVALKVLRDIPTRARSERLAREAQALAQLSHPNVVSVYDVGRAGEEVFLAMELLDGRDLGAWLAEERRPQRTILEVFRQAGEGLAAAHRAGIVHRDFKPANVFVESSGRVCVTDFGLARSTRDSSPSAIGATAAETTSIAGTPAYMAPEQLDGEAATESSDQFSFAVALCEGLFGRRPFVGADAAAIRTRIAEEPADLGRSPSWLRRLLRKALSVEPGHRFATMDELLAALRRGLRRRRIAIATAFASAAVVALAGGALALTRGVTENAEVCRGAGDKIAHIWNHERQAAAQKAFVASGLPYAGEVWPVAKAAVDRYSDGWQATWTSACKATAVTREQSSALLDARMACLERRRKELAALVDVWQKADVESIKQSTDAAAMLVPVDTCSQNETLLAVPPAPSDPDSAARITAIHDALAKARAERTSGHYPKARTTLEAAESEVRALGFGPLTAEYLADKANLLVLLDAFDEAEAAHREAIQLSATAGDTVRVARSWSDLYYLLGVKKAELEKSEALLETVTAAIALARDDVASAWFESHQASVHRAADRLQEAEEHGRKALELFEKLHGDEHSHVATAATNLGLIVHGVGKFDEALAHHGRALRIFTKVYGENHRRTAAAHNNLGMVQLGLGQEQAAHDSFAAAETIFARVLGEDNLVVAQVASNRGLTLLGLGKQDESRRTQERALAIYRKRLPADHPQIGVVLGNLAHVAFDQEDWPTAEKVLREAVGIIEPKLGKNHGQTLLFVSELADVLAAQGKCKEAEPMFARVRAGLSSAQVVDAHGVAMAIEGQARCAASPARSIDLLEEALKVRQLMEGNAVSLAFLEARLAEALVGKNPGRAEQLATHAVSILDPLGPQYAEDVTKLRKQFALTAPESSSAPKP